MEQLKNIYGKYERALVQALQNAKPLAGWFGLSTSDDPRYDPCHQAFYNEVGNWVAEFTASSPDEMHAKEAAYWILSQAAESRKKQSYWYYLATQGYVKQLLPFLSKEGCAEVLAWYDHTYPRRERLPVNDELYTQMKKSAK